MAKRERTSLRQVIGHLRRQWSPRTQVERNIQYLFLDTVSQGVLAGGLLAYIAVFIARLGGSSLLISLLTSLPALGVILFSIPAAQFVGRRRDVVRITVFTRLCIHTIFLCTAIAPFLLKDALAPVVVGLWALQALPGAVSNMAWTEVIAQAIPMDRLARVNGARWASYSVVIAISVAGFGALLERLTVPINYQIVFFASAASGFLSTFFFSRIRLGDASRPFVVRQQESAGAQLRRLIKPLAQGRGFLQFLGVGFLIRLGMNLPAALFTVFWVNNLRASDQSIGWRTTAGSLALVAGYLFWGRSVSKTGHRRALVASGVGIALYPALTALVGAPAWLIPVALVWGFFAGGLDITLFEGLLRISPQDNRTSYVALNTIFANLAIFLGPILGSLVSAAIGIYGAFLFAAGLGVTGALLVQVWKVGDPLPVLSPSPKEARHLAER